MFLHIIVKFLLIKLTVQHSWIECVDYSINSDSDLNYYDDNKCSGYPRGAQIQHSAGFGIDTGFDLRDANRCQSNNRDSYDDFTPMATYTPGQRVCLAYPAKNHVAETCTNRFIPDNGMIIKRSVVQNSDNFNNAQFYDHLNGDHIKGDIDFKGFQRCPKFCENKDKSLCTLCFDLEENTPSGIYTFKWEWEFNPGEFYYTCWDAMISGNNNPRPTPPPLPTVPPLPTDRPRCVPPAPPTLPPCPV